jgi:hypothetical protein
MNDTVALIAAVAVGVLFGWWLEGRTPGTRKLVFRITGVVLGTPLALILVASGVGSNTLGAIGGFSLMALLALAVPLGLGMLLGKLFRHSRARDSSTSELPAPQPIATTTQPAVQRSAPALSAQQRLVLLVMAGVGSGIWVALAVGFWLHDQPVPSELDAGLVPAALVLTVTLTLVVRAAWQRRASRLRNERRDIVAEYEAAAARYESDPDATACCEHLAPIELAMRRAGLHVQSGQQGSAGAPCCIDMHGLSRRFSLPASVQYHEWYSPDRSGDDPPRASLYCTACQSQLWLLHAREDRPDTPTFPA